MHSKKFMSPATSSSGIERRSVDVCFYWSSLNGLDKSPDQCTKTVDVRDIALHIGKQLVSEGSMNIFHVFEFASLEDGVIFFYEQKPRHF